MPNNITHLPTDETLENGLSLIAQALDGDKISQISAKLSSQSKSLSQIDSFLADNLSGINTKLVAKGSSAASLYSEIPGKIESIEAASTPFRLLKNVTTPTVVTNGSFTMNYEGEPPADLQTNYEGGVLLPTNRAGVNLEDISYTISSIDTVNKTITFSLQGQTDGVLTGGVGCAVAIFGKSGSIRDYEILSAATCVVVGLPINFEPHLIQPQGSAQIISFSDSSNTKIINLADDLNCIAPSGVLPSSLGGFDIEAFVYIYDETTDTITQIDCTVNGTDVTIPAEALVDGAQLNIWLDSQTDGLGSSIVLFLQEV